LIIGWILLCIIWGGKKVFAGMFQYVVWKEIITDAPEVIEKKEE
jgi:hypothetical protein